MRRLQDRLKRRFKLLNQFRPVTMIASTAPGTYNLRISAQTVTNRLREIGERPPYRMYVLYAAFLFWPSIWILCNFAQVSFLYNTRECNMTIERCYLHFVTFLSVYVHG